MSDVRLMHGDCLELMRGIPDGSIDAVICDPPFGTTACAWDTVIPFAPMWEAYKRILKPNGAIVLFGSQPFTSALIMSNPKMFRYEWIWEKPQGTGHLCAEYRPLKNHENILVFASETPRYYPQIEYGKRYSAFKGDRDTEQIYNEKTSFHNENIGTRKPKTVQKFAQEREALHPTQKPVSLLSYLIQTYTNPGELVLDNAAGSGTTGVACVQTGRNFIGMEKEERYYCTALKRIADAQAQTMLDFNEGGKGE